MTSLIPARGHTRQGTAWRFRYHDCGQAGFTLVEMMVVVAIMAILMTLAAVQMSASKSAHSTEGFADQIAAEIDGARQRAVAKDRWQLIQVAAGRVDHYEATTQGMATPTGWTPSIKTITAPIEVTVNAFDHRSHITAGDSVPSSGAGLTGNIEIAPDGSADAPATVFVGSSNGGTDYRVVLFAATATPKVYESW